MNQTINKEGNQCFISNPNFLILSKAITNKNRPNKANKYKQLDLVYIK